MDNNNEKTYKIEFETLSSRAKKLNFKPLGDFLYSEEIKETSKDLQQCYFELSRRLISEGDDCRRFENALYSLGNVVELFQSMASVYE